MQIGVHHDNDSLIVRHFLHDAANSGTVSHNAGFLSPVACHHFIPSVRFGTDKTGFQHTILTYTLHKAHHGTIHTDFERMVGEIVYKVNRNVLNPRLSSNFPFLLCGKQVI